MTIQATFTTLTLAASILSGSWTLASPEPTAGAPIVAVPSPMMWQDPAGTPLPFQNDSEVLEFLRTARVVSQKSVGVGVNEISKVLLEKDGVQLHAAFRKVSVFEPRMTMDNGDIKRNYRDDCRSFGNSKEIRFAQFIQWCRRDLWEKPAGTGSGSAQEGMQGPSQRRPDQSPDGTPGSAGRGTSRS